MARKKPNPNSALARQREDLKAFQMLSGRKDWSELPPLVSGTSSRKSANVTTSEDKFTSQFLVGAGMGSEGVVEQFDQQVDIAPESAPSQPQEPLEPAPEQELPTDASPVIQEEAASVESIDDLVSKYDTGVTLDTMQEYGFESDGDHAYDVFPDASEVWMSTPEVDMLGIREWFETTNSMVDGLISIDSMATEAANREPSLSPQQDSVQPPTEKPIDVIANNIDKAEKATTQSDVIADAGKVASQEKPKPAVSSSSWRGSSGPSRKEGKAKPSSQPAGKSDRPQKASKNSKDKQPQGKDGKQGQQRPTPGKFPNGGKIMGADLTKKSEPSQGQSQSSDGKNPSDGIGVNRSNSIYEAMGAESSGASTSNAAGAIVDVNGDMVDIMDRLTDGVSELKVKLRDIQNRLAVMGL